jgi:hypothetical protein
VDAGHGVGCGPHEAIPESCEHCGRSDGQHDWSDGDCVLPHRKHSRSLVTGTHVCQHCVNRHVDWVREITELYATLNTVLYVGSVTDEPGEYQKPRKRPASPSPLRLEAWALYTNQINTTILLPDGTYEAAYLGGNLPDVPDTLANWAQAVYDAHEWISTAPTTVSGAAAVLTADADMLAGLPDVDTYDAELRWVRRALRQAHGISDPKPLGACMSVECRGMVWPNAGQQPKCDRCGRRYGHLDLLRLQISEERTAS